MRPRIAKWHRLAGLTAAVLLVATPAASAQSNAAQSNATQSEADRMLAKTRAKDFELTSKSYRDQVDELDAKLDNTSIGAVVENTPKDHVAKPARRGFDWTGGEQNSSMWFPQGTTGSADAHASGTYDNHKIIATSWYDHDGKKKCSDCKPTKRGVRVTFVNYDNPDKPRFNHVQLVVPDGEGSIKPLVHKKDDGQESVHAGGIAWVGNYLYVADTKGGIRQFDVRHVWKAEPEPTRTKFGVHGNKLQAADYRYAIPQVGMYRNTGSDLRFSSVSVDHAKGHRALVTGEYKEKEKGGRIVRWPLRGDQLDTTNGKASARDAHRVNDKKMQGAVSYRDTFFTTHSDGYWRRMRTDWQTGARGDTPRYPEDISYNPASGRAWWLTEQPGQRHVSYTPKAMG